MNLVKTIDKYYVPFLVGSVIVGATNLIYSTQEANRLNHSLVITPSTVYFTETDKTAKQISPAPSKLTIEDKLK